ncbi:hypothetical protein [Angustibacter luteus]|uniref:Uncharacterized protein n=1 Tax=Angustibacter luteus TaxID=658456 RepID=A0ABW1JIB5_9ACTN
MSYHPLPNHPPDPIPDSAVWVARLRLAATDVQDAAATLRGRAASAGLAGPAGTALADLVGEVVREASDLSARCLAVADQIGRQDPA